MAQRFLSDVHYTSVVYVTFQNLLQQQQQPFTSSRAVVSKLSISTSPSRTSSQKSFLRRSRHTSTLETTASDDTTVIQPYFAIYPPRYQRTSPCRDHPGFRLPTTTTTHPLWFYLISLYIYLSLSRPNRNSNKSIQPSIIFHQIFHPNRHNNFNERTGQSSDTNNFQNFQENELH